MIEWLIFSMIWVGIWLLIFIIKAQSRKIMLWASILTAPFGLTEPLFVPKYWNPPSLFNLAAKTGFDIESLIFSFAIGGIGVVIYESFFKVKHKRMSMREMHQKRHRFHKLALISAPLAFLLIYFTLDINPIYSASIAMFIGGIAAIICRPDLKKKIWYSGILFTLLYFAFFLSFNLIYPNLVQEAWNLSAISGILIAGIPIEELIFAFTFGMVWSSYYEHIKWYKIMPAK